jgi:hypothetical protein
MQRIVDKKLGPQSEPRQSASGRPHYSSQQGSFNISRDEESSLKQLINPTESDERAEQNAMQRTTVKSKTVQDFAASYNKGKVNGSRPSHKPTAVKSNKMNLNDFVQTMKK